MEDCQHHHACLDDAKALKKVDAVSHGEGGQNVDDKNHPSTEEFAKEIEALCA